MARGERRDPEVKGAVLAALLTGQGVDSVAEQYNVPEGTVKTWKAELRKKSKTKAVQPEINSDQPVQPQKPAEDYSSLLDRYLRANLATLTVQLEHFADKDWLKRQSASDLAVLHGVTADKAIRILEAAERACDGASQEESES